MTTRRRHTKLASAAGRASRLDPLTTGGRANQQSIGRMSIDRPRPRLPPADAEGQVRRHRLRRRRLHHGRLPPRGVPRGRLQPRRDRVARPEARRRPSPSGTRSRRSTTTTASCSKTSAVRGARHRRAAGRAARGDRGGREAQATTSAASSRRSRWAWTTRRRSEIVRLCEDAGITLAVNQNMRFDQSIRACKDLLDRGYLGEPVLATIDMRAIPHWMPWQQRLGWVTLRIMSIHHLDTFRYCSATRRASSPASAPTRAPRRSSRTRTASACTSSSTTTACAPAAGTTSGPARRWKAPSRTSASAGASKAPTAWPAARSAGRATRPARRARSTSRRTSTRATGTSRGGRKSGSPTRSPGPMAELLVALEEKREPTISGRDNLKTMALVEACYLSAKEHRAVEIAEMRACEA